MVPDNILFVAESGIRTAADIEVLRKAKVNAVLIGEALMRSPDKNKNAGRTAGKHPMTQIKICGSDPGRGHCSRQSLPA